MMRKTIECCEYFDELATEFTWFSYEDEETRERVKVMPCSGGLRVNFCPSCGGNIRGIQVRDDER